MYPRPLDEGGFGSAFSRCAVRRGQGSCSPSRNPRLHQPSGPQQPTIPLASIDSAEKTYRPNRLFFILAMVAACLAVFLFLGGAALLEATGSAVLTGGVLLVAFGPTAAAVLVLLLKTRIVGIDVRSGNNHVAVRFGSGDSGFSEAKCDAFVQRLCEEVHRAKGFREERELASP